MARYRIKRKGDSFLRDGLILLGIMAVIGLILVMVFNMTGSSIGEGAKAAREEAYKKAFGNNELTPYEDSELNDMVKKYTSGKDTEITDAAVMKDSNGNVAGYAFIAGSKGYSGEVTVSVGITLEGKIAGIDIVSMNETAGLGAECTEPEFKKQFEGLSDEVVINKEGQENENGIDALSGATVTTEAVTQAVNACLELYGSIDIAGVKQES